MQVDHDVFGPAFWTYQYRGWVIIYVAEWEGKRYVGSTINMRTRLYSLRAHMAALHVKECRIVALYKTQDSNRFRLEREKVKEYDTVRPNGHNKTRTGNGQGPKGGRDPHIPAQKLNAKFPSLMHSPDWASTFKGLCVVYLLEWSGKRYVGTSEEFQTRLAAQRRRLVDIGVEFSRVLWYGIVEKEDRKLIEEEAVKHFKTRAPLGHNKTDNGSLKANWQDPTYRAKQKTAWTPERKAVISKHFKRLWKNPAYLARQKELKSDPVRRATQGAKVSAHWKDPVKRARYIAAIKAGQTEEVKKRISETLKKYQAQLHAKKSRKK